ncbi:MAG: hypothetical protein NBV67_09430 [Tagaea sp.]|nr:hypothetical protein [Tagaea sp.]
MIRREILGAGLAIAFAGPARAAAEFDLAALRDGWAAPETRALAGTQVRVRGFALPHRGLAARFFVLAADPATICPHCRPAPGSDAILAVEPRDRFDMEPGPAMWAGRLDLGGRIDPASGYFSRARLLDAAPVRG